MSPATPVTVIGALKVLQIELHLARHLNVEVGLDDVVVAALDEAMVGVDLDDVAVLRDLELDVVEPLAAWRGARP